LSISLFNVAIIFFSIVMEATSLNKSIRRQTQPVNSSFCAEQEKGRDSPMSHLVLE